MLLEAYMKRLVSIKEIAGSAIFTRFLTEGKQERKVWIVRPVLAY